MTAAWPGSLARRKLCDLDQRLLITCKDALVGFREAWCGPCGSLYGQDCQRRLGALTWPNEWEALLRSRRIPDPLSQEVKEQETICARVLELLSSTKMHYASGSPQLNAVLTEIVSASKAYWRRWLQQRLTEDAALWNNFALEKGYTREELASLARGGDAPVPAAVDGKPSIAVGSAAVRTMAPKAPAVAASVSTDKEPAQATNTKRAVSASPVREHTPPSAAAPLLAHDAEPPASTAHAPSPAPTVKSQRAKKKRVRLEDEPHPEPKHSAKPKSPKHPPPKAAAAAPPAPPVGLTVEEAGDGSLTMRVQPPAWWAPEHVSRFVSAVEGVWLTHATVAPAPVATPESAKAKVAKKRRLENDVAAVVKAARLPQRFVDKLRSEGPWDLESLNAVTDERLEGMGLSEKHRSGLRRHILLHL